MSDGIGNFYWVIQIWISGSAIHKPGSYNTENGDISLILDVNIELFLYTVGDRF